MPLDTGALAQGFGPSAVGYQDRRAPLSPPSLQAEATIGAALRLAREQLGLDLDLVEKLTRVRRSYLINIEDMRLDKLPSRTFTIGYIRAYAAALGLDPEAAAARFRRDVPGEDDTLRAPVGVTRQGDPRLAMICVSGAVVVAGVLLWNVAQRAAIREGSLRAGVVPVAHSLAAAPRGPITLGAPTQAPIESTTPKPYITPGMPPVSSATPIVGDPADAAIAEAAASPPSTFTPRGTVYGTPPDPSAIILQANKTALVVIHGADGSVYFARQLHAGEAYRISDAQGLTADVSDPAAFDVFVAGAFKGPLPDAKTPLSKLVG
jgi:hypothetical protein